MKLSINACLGRLRATEFIFQFIRRIKRFELQLNTQISNFIIQWSTTTRLLRRSQARSLAHATKYFVIVYIDKEEDRRTAAEGLDHWQREICSLSHLMHCQQCIDFREKVLTKPFVAGMRKIHNKYYFLKYFERLAVRDGKVLQLYSSIRCLMEKYQTTLLLRHEGDINLCYYPLNQSPRKGRSAFVRIMAIRGTLSATN